MEPGAHRTHLFAQDPGQGGREGLDHGDPGPQAVAGGRHLGADEPGSDDHDWGAFTGRPDDGPEGQAVVQRAQGVYPGHGLGARQPPGRRPGGHDQAVVGQLAAVVTADGVGGGVERYGAAPQPEVQSQRVELVRGVVVDPLDVPRTGQELLGQRWAIVGGMVLVPDDDHRPPVALVSEFLGGPQAGQGGADHDDGGLRS